MDMQPAARQARPEVTIAVCRGACRLMRQAGYSVVLELPLPDGRRADIFAVGRAGELVIVEVKSSIEDWRVDGKWPDYLDWCDQLYVAIPVDFPRALIPDEIGLIVADAYGGEVLRHPPRRPVVAARRKALLIDCARDVGAKVIVRGLRAVADFEYEFQMVGMNRALDSSIETVFLLADARRQAIASKLVKEIARLGGDVSQFVPPTVCTALMDKYA